MKIVLFGGAGFIGSNLFWHFTGQGHEVYVVDSFEASYKRLHPDGQRVFEKKITRMEDALGIMKAVTGKPDLVISLIADPYVLDQHSPEIMRETNVTANIEIAQVCAAEGIKMMFFSSAAVYGNWIGARPAGEHDRCFPISMYGLQKLEAEKLLYYLRHHSGLDYKVVRPFNVYGRSNKGLIALFERHFKPSREQQPGPVPVLHGSGSQTRSFIRVDQVARGVETIIEKWHETEDRTFNLGTSPTTIQEIFEAAGLEAVSEKYADPREIEHSIPSLANILAIDPNWKIESEVIPYVQSLLT